MKIFYTNQKVTVEESMQFILRIKHFDNIFETIVKLSGDYIYILIL